MWGDNNRIRDEEYDKIYSEMHIEFYSDFISGVNDGAKYLHGVGSGNATIAGTIVGDDDDVDTGGGVGTGVVSAAGVGGTSNVGGTYDIGVNSRPYGFTEYDDHFIST